MIFFRSSSSSKFFPDAFVDINSRSDVKLSELKASAQKGQNQNISAPFEFFPRCDSRGLLGWRPAVDGHFAGPEMRE
jgi:hypothetical protein